MNDATSKGAAPRVGLFVTCLGDTLFPEAGQAVVVQFERGPELQLENGTEQTIGARREQYPQRLRVTDGGGTLLWERTLAFSDLSENSFRLIIGREGLIPTPPQSSG